MTNNDARTGEALRRWMQAVGAFYVVQAVMMVLMRAPIRTFGPKGALAEAAAYTKIAVTSRAGAALFTAEHGPTAAAR